MVRSAKVLALSAASLAMITPGAEAFAASSGAPMALRRNNAACAVSMEAVPRMDRRAALPLAAAGLGFALFPREAFAGEPIPMDAKAPDTLEAPTEEEEKAAKLKRDLAKAKKQAEKKAAGDKPLWVQGLEKQKGKQAEAKASRKNRDNLCEALGRGC